MAAVCCKIETKHETPGLEGTNFTSAGVDFQVSAPAALPALPQTTYLSDSLQPAN